MIDFFKPVESAWARMETCLFKPFDIGKWFVLGFTAWLASFVGGGGGNANFSNTNTLSGGEDSASAGNPGDAAATALEGVFQEMAGWGWAVWTVIIVALVLLVAGLTILFQWLGCRGQFMFLDNVLHNRALVVNPWKKFRREGNSLFVFRIILLLGIMGLFLAYAGAALVFFWNDILAKSLPEQFLPYLPWLLGFGVLLLIWLGVVIFLFYVTEFGVPLMYRHRCSAMEAVGKVWKLACQRPLDFFVYLLIRIVMGMLFAILSCLAICLTLCIACIPYIGTVVLLPLPVFRLAYTLECLREFTGETFWADEIPPPLPPPTGAPIPGPV